MIKDAKLWSEWEAQGPLREPADYRRNLRLYQAMYDWARTLGVFPLADPLEGLDTKIRVARILRNVRGTAAENRPGA